MKNKIRRFELIIRMAFVILLVCVALAMIVQDHTDTLPQGLFNANRAQIQTLSLALLVVTLVSLIALVAELVRGRSWFLTRLIRMTLAFIVMFDLFLAVGDKFIMGGSAGRGTHYEDRLADGTPVIMRRSRGGMPVRICADENGDERRVLFLGDSYTEGSGRAPACNYPNVVEHVLRNDWDRRARVINAGVNAYGPVEALNLLRWYRERGCVEFEAIVYNLFLENDFTDNLPRTDRRVVAGVVFRFPQSWFLKTFHPLNTRLFRWALFVVYARGMSAGAREAATVEAGECVTGEERLEEVTPFLQRLIDRRLAGSDRVVGSIAAQRVALDAIEAMKTEAADLGVPFILVVFPDRILVDPDLRELMGMAAEEPAAPASLRRIVIDTFASGTVIDVSRELNDRPGMFRASDTHLSDLGNTVAGQYVGRDLAAHFSARD